MDDEQREGEDAAVLSEKPEPVEHQLDLVTTTLYLQGVIPAVREDERDGDWLAYGDAPDPARPTSADGLLIARSRRKLRTPSSTPRAYDCCPCAERSRAS